MAQFIDLAESVASTSESEANPFHGVRLRFNSAFLAEDFATAETVCLQALELGKLSDNEIEELLRYLRMLGKGQFALDTLNKALSQRPDLERLQMLRLDLLLQLGKLDEYEQLVKQALELFPHNDSFYRQYHDFLQVNSRVEEAESVIQQATQHGITLFQQAHQASPDEPEVDNPEVSDASLQGFMQLFAGRENAYARQWLNDQGQSGYTLVNEPLTMQALRNHILGNYTLGVYQLDSQSKVGWIVFDLDIGKEQQIDLINPEFMSWANALLLEKTQEIVQLLAFHHIPCSVENSGYKGYHIWIFLEQRISASLAKAFAERIAAQISLEVLPLQLEIFPKQTKLKQGYGNLVKLPFGIHRRSGKLSTMLDTDHNPLSLADFLVQVKKLDSQTFIAALNSLGYINSETPEPPINLQILNNPPVTIDPDPEEDIEWLCLKQNCYALSCIDNLIKTRRSITGAQKNALRYTVGYLKNGPAIVNKLLSQCHNISTEDYMKSGFKGNASGCAKIRNALSSEIDVSMCNCSFESTSAAYLNPLLHLASLAVSSSPVADLNELKLKELVDNYLRLLKNHKELTHQLNTTESQIMKVFDYTGIDHINTDYGVLCFDQSKHELTLNLKVSPKPEP